jgi:hypothetical protein
MPSSPTFNCNCAAHVWVGMVPQFALSYLHKDNRYDAFGGFVGMDLNTNRRKLCRDWRYTPELCLKFSEHYTTMNVRTEVEVNLRPTVSRSVCLGVRHPSGTRDQFLFRLEISFRQLRFYYFVAPSLTRGLIRNLLYNCFWALPEQSLLGRSPAELTAIFYCLIWDSPNLEGQVPIFISPRNRVAQLYPGHWVPILSPLTTRRAAVEVF